MKPNWNLFLQEVVGKDAAAILNYAFLGDAIVKHGIGIYVFRFYKANAERHDRMHLYASNDSMNKFMKYMTKKEETTHQHWKTKKGPADIFEAWIAYIAINDSHTSALQAVLSYCWILDSEVFVNARKEAVAELIASFEGS